MERKYHLQSLSIITWPLHLPDPETLAIDPDYLGRTLAAQMQRSYGALTTVRPGHRTLDSAQQGLHLGLQLQRRHSCQRHGGAHVQAHTAERTAAEGAHHGTALLHPAEERTPQIG